MKKQTLRFLPVFLITSLTQALINPNFTPVHLVNQSTAIWEAELTLNDDGTALDGKVTATLKGEVPAETFMLAFGARDHLKDEIESVLIDGKTAGIFLTGDFSGASMSGDDADADPWAMLKIGGRWFMVVSGDNGALSLRDDPIDLSTVWAGDPHNLRQVTEYILADPRADVPVASDGRWAEERMLAEIEGTVTGMEAVTLAQNPLLLVYRLEGDMVFSPAQDFEDISGYMGLASASAHATWGRFTTTPDLGMMSLNAEGELHLWSREGEEFVRQDTGIQVENATGMATVSLPGRAGVLIGTAEEGLVLALPQENGTWTTLDTEPPADAGQGGGVYAIDLNGNGHAEMVQSYENGLAVLWSGDEGNYADLVLYGHDPIGKPLSLAAADFDGNGKIDFLIGGERGAAMMLNDGEAFQSRMQATGELSYNIRPGVNAIGIGDHNLDGRIDLMLFNAQLPPQIYFNRGFAVFGYDMELDMIEDVPDAQDAAGAGQQAGLLADLTRSGLQEAVFVTNEGQMWLLVRETEGITPLGADLSPPATITGPVPVVIQDGRTKIGARIAQPHAPAHIGRRNRGPVNVRWKHPGDDAERTQRVIVLRPETHVLDAQSN
ncbi:MAG: VCBS repeat-containing protein [Verrucomicrobia bacterium]|nr:VCBS repeat-containing protein [Verrucomicrobiota bacterium]MCH8513970.1 VCBS repeat-containing protein [Kiritimatiellia bacterium]